MNNPLGVRNFLRTVRKGLRTPVYAPNEVSPIYLQVKKSLYARFNFLTSII